MKTSADLPNGMKVVPINVHTELRPKNDPGTQLFPLETEEVTFSKIVVQSLKLFSKFDKAEIILNIIIKIVSHVFFLIQKWKN